MAAAKEASSDDHTSKLTRNDFFYDLSEALRGSLPDDLGDYQEVRRQQLIKIHYRNPRIHYEVWANGRDGHIEIGLHFEEGPESTDQLMRFFDRHIIELKDHLGPDLELERWTKSWGHLYQLLPYQPLSTSLAHEIATRLSRMICAIEPLIDEAPIQNTTRRNTLSRRRWSR